MHEYKLQWADSKISLNLAHDIVISDDSIFTPNTAFNCILCTALGPDESYEQQWLMRERDEIYIDNYMSSAMHRVSQDKS